MSELVEITSGLRFPEGPIAMPDGTVILVEMFGERLTRVHPDGRKETVAEVPGGPNGAAIGPDGAIYVCNNGGRFTEMDFNGMTFPGPVDMNRYSGGRIERVDIATGAITTLYTECGGHPLRAPNDLVFDGHGGFYFTDHGLDVDRIEYRTGIYYALADGSSITEVVFPASHPNGIGLSPDGTVLHWAETQNGRLQRRRITAPGVLETPAPLDPFGMLYGFPGLQLLDSLAVDSAGNVCVATLVNGGVSVISPEGELVDFVPTGDLLTTNICFGGADLTTAYITVSATGKLLKTTWPRPGAKLHHLNV